MAPAHVAEIRPIFDGRVAAARSVWEKYEEEKAKLREQNLSGAAYELAAASLRGFGHMNILRYLIDHSLPEKFYPS